MKYGFSGECVWGSLPKIVSASLWSLKFPKRSPICASVLLNRYSEADADY